MDSIKSLPTLLQIIVSVVLNLSIFMASLFLWGYGLSAYESLSGNHCCPGATMSIIEKFGALFSAIAVSIATPLYTQFDERYFASIFLTDIVVAALMFGASFGGGGFSSYSPPPYKAYLFFAQIAVFLFLQAMRSSDRSSSLSQIKR